MKVSVYITSYNQKGYLVEAVDSVLAQTLKPHQVIIVDDCSTDGSREVVEGYHSRHPGLITPILNSRNKGIGQVRVDALNAVTGRYVTFLDGDDRFLSGKLEKEAKAIKNSSGAGIAFSNYYYIDEHGSRTGVWAEGERPPQGEIFKEVFARDFPHGSLFRNELVDYDAWKKVGFHDPAMNLYEDYEMRVRLTKTVKAVYVDEPLSEYRRHSEGLSRLGVMASRLEAFEYIYSKNKALLDDLSDADRRHVQKRLAIMIARFARVTARENLSQRDFSGALKYYFRSFSPMKGL